MTTFKCHVYYIIDFVLVLWSLIFIHNTQWTADGVNDMYADAVIAVLLQVCSQQKQFSGGSLKILP